MNLLFQVNILLNDGVPSLRGVQLVLHGILHGGAISLFEYGVINSQPGICPFVHPPCPFRGNVSEKKCRATYCNRRRK